ncbi:ribosome recycling factor [Buchnera aphidicola (Neophyllaphis varicolor)]|uniref:ribosome recycling factor n=1 Tax=Buchnera aphidicola TaxID=9 RepID=UPI0031B83AE4
MINNIINKNSIKMQKCIKVFKTNLNKINTGRASTLLIENLMVDYYNVMTPLKQISNITVENANLLKITVFDNSIVKSIEKSILSSELNLNPISKTNNCILVPIPLLTEDRRINLIKIIQRYAEKTRICIRNIRKISKDKIKLLLKNKEISLDQDRYAENKIQTLTDDYISETEIILSKKKLEIKKV